MNRSVAAALLAAVTLSVGCGGSGERGPRNEPNGPTSLERFARSDLGEMVLCGIGMSTGYAIVLAVRSAASGPRELVVRPGIRLASNDPGSQDMVVQRVEAKRDGDTADDLAQACADAAKDFEEQPDLEGLPPGWSATTTLSLQPGATEVYLLSAFCLDFEKENPGSATRFTVSRDLNPQTAALFDSLAALPDTFGITAIQLATWALNGDPALNELLEKFEFFEEDRAEACRLLERAGLGPGQRNVCQNLAA